MESESELEVRSSSGGAVVASRPIFYTDYKVATKAACGGLGGRQMALASYLVSSQP